MNAFFKLNPDKLHAHTGHYRRIVGVSFNDHNEMVTKRTMYRNIRTALYKLSQDKANEVMPINKLKGKIAYAKMVDKSGKYERLFEQYSEICEKYKLTKRKD